MEQGRIPLYDRNAFSGRLVLYLYHDLLAGYSQEVGIIILDGNDDESTARAIDIASSFFFSLRRGFTGATFCQ